MNALFTSRRSIWFQSQAAINAEINTLTFDEAKEKVESYMDLHYFSYINSFYVSSFFATSKQILFL